MGVEMLANVGKIAAVVPSVGRATSLGPNIGGLPVPVDMGVKVMNNPFKGEITFPKSEPLVIRQAEQVAAAAWEKNESPASIPAAPQSEVKPTVKMVAHPFKESMPAVKPLLAPEVIMPQANPLIVATAKPRVEQQWYPQPAFHPAVSSQVELSAQPTMKTETKPAQRATTSSARAVLAQPALQEEEAEEVLIREKIEARDKLEEKEEIEQVSLKDVVDEAVAEQRIYEFDKAIDQTNGEEVDGKEAIQFLPSENEENRSGVIKSRGPDGSRIETIEAFAARKYASKEQAKREIRILVPQKEPVKKARYGRLVRREALARVLKYLVRPVIVAQDILIKRVVKKRGLLSRQNPVQIITEEKVEPTIEDLGLGEVFPKAA